MTSSVRKSAFPVSLVFENHSSKSYVLKVLVCDIFCLVDGKGNPGHISLLRILCREQLFVRLRLGFHAIGLHRHAMEMEFAQ